VKIDKKSFTLLRKIVNIPKEDMEHYHWTMFTHAIDLFQERASLKKPIPKHFVVETIYYTIWFPLATSYQ